jgi:hypothetical protein
VPFLRRLGVPAKAWRAGSDLLVLRAVSLSPFLADPGVRAFYRAELLKALENLLGPSTLGVPLPAALAAVDGEP